MQNAWEPAEGSAFGPYEILSLIGRGGTSVVYRGHCPQRNGPVALKVLRPEFRLDSTYRARLEREGQALRGLPHPNLLQFLDSGEASPLLYVVLEFVSGISLRQLLQLRGQLDIEQALHIHSQILDGLAFAHSHGICHRDLKPENILLPDQSGLKISDFGCAKGPGLANVTAEGVVLGTPTYMAPEHFQDRHLPASDQYAAAIILYEMLCGRVPFDETDPVRLAMAHVGKKPPPPQQFRPELPQILNDAILKGLAKMPEQRFATLEAFSATAQGAV